MKRITKVFEWGTRDLVEYDCEDWLSNNMPKVLLLSHKKDEYIPIEVENQQYEVGVLPLTEYEKIAAIQQEVAEKYINYHLEALKSDFAKRMGRSKEPKLLIESELQMISDITMGKKDLTNTPSFGGLITHEAIEVAKWYQRIIIKGDDVWKHIEPQYVTKDFSKITEKYLPAYAEILWRYQKHLELLITDIQNPTKPDLEKRIETTLPKYIISPETFDIAQNALIQLQLLNDLGKYKDRNYTPIKALYKVLKDKAYIEGTESHLSKAFAAFLLEHFNISISDRALQSRNNNQKELERELKALIPLK